jgi:hypothetical protein
MALASGGGPPGVRHLADTTGTLAFGVRWLVDSFSPRDQQIALVPCCPSLHIAVSDGLASAS